MSSSSEIGSLCKKHERENKKLGSNEDEKKNCFAPNLVLTQNTQADLTHHLFNIHLPPLIRTIDLPEPTHHLQSHLAPDLVLELKGPGQVEDGGCVVGLRERDDVHQQELEDLVEVRRGERAQGALWACE